MEWYEDPIFDEATEVYDGKLYTGDKWRELQRWKETMSNKMRDLETAFQKQVRFSSVMKSSVSK